MRSPAARGSSGPPPDPTHRGGDGAYVDGQTEDGLITEPGVGYRLVEVDRGDTDPPA
jgi:hypothetical protein